MKKAEILKKVKKAWREIVPIGTERHTMDLTKEGVLIINTNEKYPSSWHNEDVFQADLQEKLNS